MAMAVGRPGIKTNMGFTPMSMRSSPGCIALLSNDPYAPSPQTLYSAHNGGRPRETRTPHLSALSAQRMGHILSVRFPANSLGFGRDVRIGRTAASRRFGPF